MIRLPAVAGRFYPLDSQELVRQIDSYSQKGIAKIAALGCVVPHAGYAYSGHVAGAVYSSLEVPERCILLGPNHYSRSESMAILSQGSWQTPLGAARIDSDLAAALASACPRLREDAGAHEREHSLEVQIPFLQHQAPKSRFVPIVLGMNSYADLEELGSAIARVATAQGERILVIASSDMNHYESDAVTRMKDARAIARIVDLDPGGLLGTVRSEGITMCGSAAATAMLVAVRALGATRTQVARYATSGDVTGDLGEVVGYAGILVW